jgi:hypothetical protein
MRPNGRGSLSFSEVELYKYHLLDIHSKSLQLSFFQFQQKSAVETTPNISFVPARLSDCRLLPSAGEKFEFFMVSQHQMSDRSPRTGSVPYAVSFALSK